MGTNYHRCRGARGMCYAGLLGLMAGAVAWADEPPQMSAPFAVDLDLRVPLPAAISAQSRSGMRFDGTHPLVARGETLVDAEQQPVRLWGMAITMARDFPPKDKDEARAVVARLKSMGFNFVRLDGLDYPRFGMFEEWRAEQRLPQAQLERLDYFICVLREEGFYYSISLNNSTRKFDNVSSVRPNQRNLTHKRYKHIQLFDPDAIELSAQWISSVLAHRNAYTDIRYAQDPALVYLTGIGEDSMFQVYFRQFDVLGEENTALLERLWGRFLLSRYGSADALTRAWGEAGSGRGPARGRVLEGQRVVLPRAKELARLGPAIKRDVAAFLLALDTGYAARIEAAARGVGFEGLYTGTGNWWGLGGLLGNVSSGSFTDMIGYFGHPLNAVVEGRKGAEVTRNISYLSALAADAPAEVTAFRRGIYKFFAMATVDRPSIVTEWNHGGSSHYAYEGPVLLSAYAAFQGWSGMAVHTLLSPTLPYTSGYANRSLSASGNPVLLSLMPTLSLAYLRGDVAEGNRALQLALARDEPGALKRVANANVRLQLADKRLPLNLGFVRKLRMQPTGEPLDKAQVNALKASLARDQWRTDTGELMLQLEDSKQAWFRVDTPRYKALVGNPAGTVALGNVKITQASDGTITAIALDDVPIEASSRVLVTTVSRFQNTGLVTEPVSGARYGKHARRVVQSGEAPVMMERLGARVELLSSHPGEPQVVGIDMAGREFPLSLSVAPGPQSEDDQSYSSRRLSFQTGTVPAQWYLLRFTQP